MTDDYDLVLVGASGFTGGLVAEYLAAAAPDGLRWALAGRDERKLAAVRDRVAAADARWTALPTMTVDVTDPGSAAALARSTRVVATTVGPYARYGDALVGACADAGRSYADLAGEPQFIDRMYVRHHARALETGARLVHACGFDSIPYDLGVLYTVDQLPDDVAIQVDGVVRVGGSVSGGTFASLLEAMARPGELSAAARERGALEQRIDARSARAVLGTPARRDGLWLLPLPLLDPQIVARSARMLPTYGPDFRYREFAGFRHLPSAVGAVAGFGVLAGLATIPPVRSRLAGLLPSGSGPSADKRATNWFTVRFTARTPARTLVTEVSGGDPGYGATAMMFGQAALCLASDELPERSGQLTPATAMGRPLIDRLQNAGITFRTITG